MNKVRFGNIYAVNCGRFRGQLFVFVKMEGEEFGMLSLPLMKKHIVPKEEFEKAQSSDIITFVERIPSYVRKVVKAKYETEP